MSHILCRRAPPTGYPPSPISQKHTFPWGNGPELESSRNHHPLPHRRDGRAGERAGDEPPAESRTSAGSSGAGGAQGSGALPSDEPRQRAPLMSVKPSLWDPILRSGTG